MPSSGIIPAYAGSTLSMWRSRMRLGDHPRVRGEHEFFPYDSSRKQGSSPRTRGARCTWRTPQAPPGIIPAYAGSTPSTYYDEELVEDHPRVRGEHERFAHVPVDRRGSSPRTRGALKKSYQKGSFLRIIPAYAGSTQALGSRSACKQDHPRVRGEHRCVGGEVW